MGKPAKRRLPRPGAKAAVAGLVAGAVGYEALAWIIRQLSLVAYGTYENNFTDGNAFYRVVKDILDNAMPTYVVAYGAALVGVPLILALRFFARDRVRAGKRDPLDRLRAFAGRHPWLPVVPAAAWTGLLGLAAVVSLRYWDTVSNVLVTQLPGMLFGFAGVYALARAFMRGITAPTIDRDAGAGTITIRDDEITFSAVAVTPETKAQVAAVAIAPQIVTVLMATLKMAPSLGWLVIAYAAVIAASIAAFSRASRVAVGIDGVLVRGTSRRRFFSYREIDGARLRGADLELLRGSKVVLRLQLHGGDAGRAEAVLARIQGHVARVAERRTGAGEGLVQTASAEQITRAVAGAVDFRQPTISREALWEIVEGPTVDGAAREAAAKALARTAAGEDRARLRVAASRCADPQVRVAIERLDEAEHEDSGAGAAEDASPVARRAVLGR